MIAIYPRSSTTIALSHAKKVTIGRNWLSAVRLERAIAAKNTDDLFLNASHLPGSTCHHRPQELGAIDSETDTANQVARVLIVEDESIVALDLRNTLRRLGYQVTFIANSGEEAVNSVIQTTPDLILMDIRLHGQMDGIQAATIIKSRFDIPVIFLTAQSDEITRKRADAVSPASYLTKPYSTADLHTAITTVLDAWKARHQGGQQAHT
jgi:CheY-like chemotaxis protein